MEGVEAKCLGDKLPERWWLDNEILLEEVKFHGGPSAASKAHKESRNAVGQAWTRSGLGALYPVHTGKLRKPVEDLGESVSEVDILRAENRQFRQLLARIREGEVSEERVVTRIITAIQNTTPLPEARYSNLKRPDSIGTHGDTEFALLFSDSHASEVVRLRETEGLNAYDWAIMEQRIGGMIESVFSHQEHFSERVSKLHVWALGDMLSGDIHEELAITNDRPAAEACVDFAYLFADMLVRLSGEFTEIEVHGVPGNHPRASKKPAAKQSHNNADWLMYKMAEALLKDNTRIKFDIGHGAYKMVMVAGRWRALLMHGDGIRSTMPGVPWGGVVRRITTLEQQFSKAKQPIDFVALGHFHTANTLDGVQARTFMNGSVKGLDEYSLKQFGSGRDACQMLLAFHKRRGWTGSFPLDLQDVTPASEGWGSTTREGGS